MKIIDISPEICHSTPVWPGDTPFQVSWPARMETGASCNVSSITTTPHVGAHADGPLHFEHDAPAVGKLALGPYLGKCRVVDITGSLVVDEEAMFGQELGGVQRVLFKTGTCPDPRAWNDDFAHLDPHLARHLGKLGIILVGIDTPSVDAFGSKDLPSHHALLEMGMRNLEGLDLSQVEAGDYELIALPLRLMEADSSPVRAVLRTLE